MKKYWLIQVFLTLCAISQCVVAEGIAIPLKALVKEAGIIVHVHRPAQKFQSEHQIVRFDVLKTFKGTKYTSIDICNGDKSTDRYDLNGFNAKEMILFLRAEPGRCLSPTGSLGSTIMVVDGVAHTSVIRDQPPEQSLDEFVRKIVKTEGRVN